MAGQAESRPSRSWSTACRRWARTLGGVLATVPRSRWSSCCWPAGASASARLSSSVLIAMPALYWPSSTSPAPRVEPRGAPGPIRLLQSSTRRRNRGQPQAAVQRVDPHLRASGRGWCRPTSPSSRSWHPSDRLSPPAPAAGARSAGLPARRARRRDPRVALNDSGVAGARDDVRHRAAVGDLAARSAERAP